MTQLYSLNNYLL